MEADTKKGKGVDLGLNEQMDVGGELAAHKRNMTTQTPNKKPVETDSKGGKNFKIS